MEKKKIFNIKQIEGACVIGSPLVAGILIYLNYKNFGEKQKGISWIFIGVLWTFALIGLGFLMPENIVDSTGFVIPAINGLILYPIINKLQGAQIREHFENNGEKGSNWIVAGLIIFILAIILTPIIALDRVFPINDYKRQPFNSNAIYYNTEMPVKKVNKLGGILKRIGYFNPKTPSEVVFIRTDSTFEFKLITEKKFFNDSGYIKEAKQIFKHIERYDFNRPMRFMLTDPYLANNQTIKLDNYDAIPEVLEAVEFKQNNNFNLIYDISIDKDERDKFQRAILNMNRIFPSQNRIDFLMDYESRTYYLKLFIPKQNWKDTQLLSEVKIVKKKLNNLGFDYPFKLFLVDNSKMDNEEYEIK